MGIHTARCDGRRPPSAPLPWGRATGPVWVGLVGGVVMGLASATLAATITSPSGYSLTVPDAWTVVPILEKNVCPPPLPGDWAADWLFQPTAFPVRGGDHWQTEYLLAAPFAAAPGTAADPADPAGTGPLIVVIRYLPAAPDGTVPDFPSQVTRDWLTKHVGRSLADAGTFRAEFQQKQLANRLAVRIRWVRPYPLAEGSPKVLWQGEEFALPSDGGWLFVSALAPEAAFPAASRQLLELVETVSLPPWTDRRWLAEWIFVGVIAIVVVLLALWLPRWAIREHEAAAAREREEQARLLRRQRAAESSADEED